MPESDFRRVHRKLIEMNSRFSADQARETFVIEGYTYTLKELLELERDKNLNLIGLGELRERKTRP